LAGFGQYEALSIFIPDLKPNPNPDPMSFINAANEALTQQAEKITAAAPAPLLQKYPVSRNLNDAKSKTKSLSV